MVQGESHGVHARRVSHRADAISDCPTPTCCARVRTYHAASRLPTRPDRRCLVFLGTGGRLPWRSRCIATAPWPRTLSPIPIAERLALPHALAVRADRVVLVLQIGAQHLLGLLRELHRERRRRRHAAQVVDVLRHDERMLQFLARVLLELLRDAHVLRALQHLRVHDVGDDCLVFPGKVLVQSIHELLSGHGRISHRLLRGAIVSETAGRTTSRARQMSRTSFCTNTTFMNRMHALTSHGLASVLVCAAAVFVSAQTAITPPPNNYTPEQDVELGRKAAAEARQQLPIMRDDAVSSYVDDIGHRLADAIAPA